MRQKVALVTGGGSGLGAAIARALVREGATVMVTDIRPDAGQRVADELHCRYLQQDVADEQQWQAIVENVERECGGLHVLVNNAGIEGPFDAADPETTHLADWQRIQRVNVEGVFLGCRAAIPVIRRSGGGSIVNVSSVAALGATPGFVAYGASKAAMHHFTKSVALYCATNGSKIRCNSVHPGVVMTPMLRRICEDMGRRRGISAEQVVEEFRARIPLGEFVEPEDVANAVLFLASDTSRRITGMTFIVDGGSTLGQ
jgi:3(or 17)beta-hydroxysteroid dehydrogenase